MREHKRLCNAILIANKLAPIIILSSLRENETFTVMTAALIITKIHKIGFQLRKHNKKELEINITLIIPIIKLNLNVALYIIQFFFFERTN